MGLQESEQGSKNKIRHASWSFSANNCNAHIDVLQDTTMKKTKNSQLNHDRITVNYFWKSVKGGVRHESAKMIAARPCSHKQKEVRRLHMSPMSATSVALPQSKELDAGKGLEAGKEQELEQGFELDIRVSSMKANPQAKCHASYTSSRLCCVPW